MNNERSFQGFKVKILKKKNITSQNSNNVFKFRLHNLKKEFKVISLMFFSIKIQKNFSANIKIGFKNQSSDDVFEHK